MFRFEAGHTPVWRHSVRVNHVLKWLYLVFTKAELNKHS